MTPVKSKWHNFDAYVLENDAMRVIIVPERGAKIASIFDKRINREWLIQPTRFPVPVVPYRADYLPYDMNSWDEMFPTIVTDTYPVEGKYRGNPLPDHGEVWALAWSASTDGHTLTVTVEGRALPYRLSRKATLESTATLRLDYSVANTGDETLYYLWAAHPLYAMDLQTEIVLPPEVNELYNVHEIPPWGAHGRRYAYPHPETSDGKQWDLRRVGSPALNTCRKFYVPPELSVSWAGFRQLDSGAWLRMDWDAGKLPYLGLWIDEGAYATVSTVALEPTNAFYDGVTIAYNNNRIATLATGETATWAVTVWLDDGENPIAG